MEAARNLVGVVVRCVLEFTTSVQLGHDNLGCRYAFFGVHAGRNPSTIIFDRHRSVGVEFDQHQIAMPGERFVDCIVRNLENHVVQPRTVVGIADIHAGAFAHGIEALQHLDAVGTIFILVGVSGAVAGLFFVNLGH